MELRQKKVFPMHTLKRELLHYDKDWVYPEVYAFTANRTLDVHMRLVMGAGAALAVKNAFPQAPKLFGNSMLINSDRLVTVHDIEPKRPLAAVTVKHHWRHPADPALIRDSFHALHDLATQFGWRVHCNYPGVGRGGLKFEEVEDILRPLNLTENIHLYYVV